MKQQCLPSFTFSSKPSEFIPEHWFDDACIHDMDYFIKTLEGVKAKGARPDLVGSIIVHYASKWLPELAIDHNEKCLPSFIESSSPSNVTSLWMRKRFFVETLVGVLPSERDSVSCNFLLRLLSVANMVGMEPMYVLELEKKISWQLDQASLEELMVPSFDHTCGTLLDVGLVIRLVKRFMNSDEVSKSGSSIFKVAKLVDSYLNQVALDSKLMLQDFITLADALPSHARGMDDDLYRAIDTYLRTHQGVTKQEKKTLCELIDSRKLSPEASLHAAKNENLPIRAVIQILLCEQSKLSYSPSQRLNSSTRRYTKGDISAQQMEIKKLTEDVHRLQSQCYAMQVQMNSLLEKKKGFFKWRKLGLMTSFKCIKGVSEKNGDGEAATQTPMTFTTKLVQPKTPPNWRRSLS